MNITPHDIAPLVAKIEAAKARVAAERDQLRELIGELESLAEDCDEATDSLTDAADALSRLV